MELKLYGRDLVCTLRQITDCFCFFRIDVVIVNVVAGVGSGEVVVAETASMAYDDREKKHFKLYIFPILIFYCVHALSHRRCHLRHRAVLEWACVERRRRLPCKTAPINTNDKCFSLIHSVWQRNRINRIKRAFWVTHTIWLAAAPLCLSYLVRKRCSLCAYAKHSSSRFDFLFTFSRR